MTGIILAGGKNSRIGTKKAFLAIGGKRILDRLLEDFNALFEETIIVANEAELYHDFNYEYKVVKDIFPGKGSLGGIYTGIKNASYSHSFCIACDMPFVKPALIKYMMGLVDDYDVVIPKVKDGLHPLHAIYSKQCLPYMEKLIADDSLKIINFFPKVKVKYILEDEVVKYDNQLLSFYNINTQDDLKLAKNIAATEKKNG